MTRHERFDTAVSAPISLHGRRRECCPVEKLAQEFAATLRTYNQLDAYHTHLGSAERNAHEQLPNGKIVLTEKWAVEKAETAQYAHIKAIIARAKTLPAKSIVGALFQLALISDCMDDLKDQRDDDDAVFQRTVDAVDHLLHSATAAIEALNPEITQRIYSGDYFMCHEISPLFSTAQLLENAKAIAERDRTGTDGS
jgi:hypothetical protein